MRAVRKWQLAMMVLCVSAAMPALAKMQQRPVEWQVDGASYSGVLVYDDAGDAKRPGVVMVPNWRGVNASAIDKAAKKGQVKKPNAVRRKGRAANLLRKQAAAPAAVPAAT